MSRSMLRAARTVLSGALIFAAGWGVARAADPDQVDQLRRTRSCRACDLSGAQLAGTDLQAADVRGTNLSNADLSSANLYRAIFVGADMTGASLSGANLSGADLRGARGLSLTGATTNEQTYCPGGQHGPCQ